ncbi:GIY-YIG nuclease family protein [Vibrio vulnificus]|uniref:GIY-YIG nuclease family protein n=1 Tax=Vibrio vulnificus TaxID=672 RepID=UPI001A27F585|nr:GIY-YIG nuclease family protein [Vibrio vulnificus]ELK8310251.1 GIY-YIG nuclease family protein [Vibrio vulnificus]ELL0586034.1 GIY-YIG nuclease family protein [Vibrio vulnificus]ELV8707521.1 GIY-YIG nuclease family protein [Vibrio vulnificus]MCA3984058.1 GIY-YIG nuclease family protein [Vibrio vulnificus]MCU8177910.1 GIY-YIG nuclease family protein [Vibrio vulnificus]
MSLPCVYILASQPYGTLYIGVTDGFTKKYRVVHLVYFEQFEAMSDAILREKQLKKWNRQWKIQLIESANPHWLDLYKNLRTTIR